MHVIQTYIRQTINQSTYILIHTHVVVLGVYLHHVCVHTYMGAPVRVCAHQPAAHLGCLPEYNPKRLCCSALQCVAVCCSVLTMLQCVAVCCSVFCSVSQCLPEYNSTSQVCVAVCCSVLQCVAVCGSV